VNEQLQASFAKWADVRRHITKETGPGREALRTRNPIALGHRAELHEHALAEKRIAKNTKEGAEMKEIPGCQLC